MLYGAVTVARNALPYLTLCRAAQEQWSLGPQVGISTLDLQ